jgi:hypothetical protein
MQEPHDEERFATLASQAEERGLILHHSFSERRPQARYRYVLRWNDLRSTRGTLKDAFIPRRGDRQGHWFGRGNSLDDIERWLDAEQQLYDADDYLPGPVGDWSRRPAGY